MRATILPYAIILTKARRAAVSIVILSTGCIVVYYRRRVSSVVEHSSANPKVPSSIPGPVSYQGYGL